MRVVAGVATAGSTDALLWRLRRRLPEGGLLGEETWEGRHRAILVLLVAHAAAIAAVGVITKPFDLDVVVTEVQRHLTRPIRASS